MVLENALGHRVTLSATGAAIISIVVPDARGVLGEVTVHTGKSAGKTIGRYANRIADGRFQLDGTTYTLPLNDGRTTLHGGPQGFSARTWDTIGSAFHLRSPDGDQGFPGTLACEVRYAWDDTDALRIDYRATTDKPTVLNLTNHVYFNLRGSGSIESHELQIAAERYTVEDGDLVPTGEIANVAGTRYDFRRPRAIGAELYDINFVLDDWDGTLRTIARVSDPVSGRVLVVQTTQPGLQLYTGVPGALALETQHFADSPNHPHFPSTVLRPNQTFTATTVYRFMVD